MTKKADEKSESFISAEHSHFLPTIPSTLPVSPLFTKDSDVYLHVLGDLPEVFDPTDPPAVTLVDDAGRSIVALELDPEESHMVVNSHFSVSSFFSTFENGKKVDLF